MHDCIAASESARVSVSCLQQLAPDHHAVLSGSIRSGISSRRYFILVLVENRKVDVGAHQLLKIIYALCMYERRRDEALVCSGWRPD